MDIETVQWDLPPVGRVSFAMRAGAGDRASERLRSSYRSLPAVHLCIALAQEGRRLVDVGASVGMVTYPCALRGARVLAIEALPSNVEILRAGVELNGIADRVDIAHVAVLDRPGEVSVIGETTSGCVVESGGHSRVRGERLATILREHGVGRVDLLKMDIEGSELPALRGSPEVFEGEAAPDVVIEANGAHCYERGHRPDELLGFFEARGYSAFAVHGRRLLPRRAADFQEFACIDYYLTREPRRAAAIPEFRVASSDAAMVADELLTGLASPKRGYRRFLAAELAAKRPAALADSRVMACLREMAERDKDAHVRELVASILR